jgi:hypothetical protein
VSGQPGALEQLLIYDCNKLQSLHSFGDLPSLETLEVLRCKRLASLPGGNGTYSALQRVWVKYCPAMDMKPLYKLDQQRLDRLEYRDISHAHSSDPREGISQSRFTLLRQISLINLPATNSHIHIFTCALFIPRNTLFGCSG